MSCVRLKHSLTVPAYSEQRSTLAELGLGRKSTPAVASVPATGAPAAKEQVETSPQIGGGPVVPTGRENIVASADCGHDGRIHADLVWSKLRTLVESARLASTSLRAS